jgi:hypothetical protein
MPTPQLRPQSDPDPIHRKAVEDLTFIRDTMARATPFTAVPGWGGVAMGVTALAASWVAAQRSVPAEWLAVWLAEAALAMAIGGFTLVRKAQQAAASSRGTSRPPSRRARC